MYCCGVSWEQSLWCNKCFCCHHFFVCGKIFIDPQADQAAVESAGVKQWCHCLMGQSLTLWPKLGIVICAKKLRQQKHLLHQSDCPQLTPQQCIMQDELTFKSWYG